MEVIQGFKGAEIKIQDKDFSYSRYIIGGTMFGLGISRLLSRSDFYFNRKWCIIYFGSIDWRFIRYLYIWNFEK